MNSNHTLQKQAQHSPLRTSPLYLSRGMRARTDQPGGPPPKLGGRRERSRGLKPVIFAFVSPTEVARGIQGHPAPHHQSLLPAVSDPPHPVRK